MLLHNFGNETLVFFHLAFIKQVVWFIAFVEEKTFRKAFFFFYKITVEYISSSRSTSSSYLCVNAIEMKNKRVRVTNSFYCFLKTFVAMAPRNGNQKVPSQHEEGFQYKCNKKFGK